MFRFRLSNFLSSLRQLRSLISKALCMLDGRADVVVLKRGQGGPKYGTC